VDIFEAMEKRHSVRIFDTSREVAPELVDELLRCACLAPTAGNVQPWRFFVVREPQLKEALARAALGQGFVATAPLDIVACADLQAHATSYGKRGAELYAIQDTAAAVQNILLTATSLGLGSCWVGAFNEEEAARTLDLPKQIRPLAIIPIGYSLRSGRQPRKLSHKRITTYLE
jgi:nitroreductase